MAIYDNVLYWTEDGGTSLFSVSLRNNQEETIVLHDIIPLSSIVIWNPKLTGKQQKNSDKVYFLNSIYKSILIKENKCL